MPTLAWTLANELDAIAAPARRPLKTQGDPMAKSRKKPGHHHEGTLILSELKALREKS
jgi:hypothetical protein